MCGSYHTEDLPRLERYAEVGDDLARRLGED
jgi:hypothetical protein